MKRWSLIGTGLLLGALLGTVITGSWLRGQNTAAPAPAVFARELTSYRDVVKRVLPAVVSIEARHTPKVKQAQKRAPGLDDEQIPEEFRRFFERMQPRLPDAEPTPSFGFGSGFLVDPRGLILTNHHVVDGADLVEVTLENGKKFQSKEIKIDPKTDLALVKIESREPLPYLELGDSSSMEIGDRVLAVGAPFGLAGSVTHGIISAKERSLRVNQYEDFLQTDAAINPGNSGGPLVNLEGKVIGINAAIKSRSGGFQGVGLAISSNLARNVMQQLQTNGVVRRGYLGVQIKDIDSSELAAKLGLKDTHGVVVTQIFDSTPASKAGLKDGDVIVSLNDQVVKDGRNLQTVVAGLPLGKPVDLTVVRDGERQKLQVVIEEQPERFGRTRVPVPSGSEREEKASVNLDKLGVEVAELTEGLASSFGFKENVHGVVIISVEANGLGAQAGLRRGMLVTRVDRQPVTSVSKLKELIDAASLKAGVLLQVQSATGGTGYVVVKQG
jgi:serine protease Do